MRRILCAFLCLVASAQTSIAQGLDKTRLRQAIELPTLNTSLGVSFRSNERDGQGNKLDPVEKLTQLQKKMTGRPEDAEILLEQRALYLEGINRNEGKAQAVVAQAEALVRPLVATTDPKQGHLLTTYATTLEILKADPWSDCEKWARRAVSVSPQDWRTWAYLAHVRHQQIPSILCGGDDKDLSKKGRAEEVIGRLILQRFRPEHVDLAEKALNEALQYHDKAKELAPNEPQRQVRRYGFRLAEIVLRNAIDVSRGKKPAYPRMQFERILLNELLATAQLHPDHILWQSQLAHQLVMLGWKENQDKDRKTFKAATPQDEQAIRTALARIEKLATDGKGETEAYCRLILAAMYSSMHENASVEKHARRALQVDPKSQTASEQLQQALVQQGRTVDQLAAAQNLVKNLPTSRNFYILAKALVANQRYDLAEPICLAGLKENPNDPHCLLGLAALTMRKADDAQSLRVAQNYLDRGSLACRPEMGASLLTDLEFLTAIHQALGGETTLARLKLQRMQADDAGNARYEKALIAFRK
ncbi:MAG: hypothetical protein HYX68_26880 [Planctomycetes bacterium]|nr:hypothetical protein [Planctomycetota bacterium]